MALIPETADSLVIRYEKLLGEDKNIERFQTVVGKQENAWGVIERPSVGQISVRTVEPEKRIRTTLEEMKYVTDLAKQVPGLIVRTSPVGFSVRQIRHRSRSKPAATILIRSLLIPIRLSRT